MKIESRYTDGSYFKKNPSWDRKDSKWKADLVLKMLKSINSKAYSFCEIGCGAGDILHCLKTVIPEADFVGYDISPQLENFWAGNNKISFHLANFHSSNDVFFDVLLMLDVFEHVRDPYTFLEESKRHAKNFVFHIPLDLSSSSVLRNSPLIDVRRSVGHLHFYTKDLAIETLTDCGYEIIHWEYSGAPFNAPNPSITTRLFRPLRKILYLINKDMTIRIFGGETLIVIAR